MYKGHSTYATNDVMNMTFNRSSLAVPGCPFLQNESPKQSEFPYDYFDSEKKDSLKLSSGEYEAFTQIKVQNPNSEIHHF